MIYNWQQEDWPQFRYDLTIIEELLYAFTERTGRISGFLMGVSDDVQTEVMIDILVSEAVKTSEIEGEYLSRKDVMSSIRKNLGIEKQPVKIRDKRAQGIAELMINVRNTFVQKLTAEMLFSWHQMVMKADDNISKGHWRSHEEPMQVVSGAMGREKVHFQAPPSHRIPSEMQNFITWFNDTAPEGPKAITQPVIRAAITHVYFESIHPFEDGNGRIGRALSEKALSQSVNRPVLLSLSRAIEKEKKEYYQSLERAQKSNEITPWITWFVKMTLNAQIHTEEKIEFILKKTHFFDRFKDLLNDRQMKVVRRMLAEGPDGFEGGMNARKYVSLTRASKATATRDLQDMVQKKVLLPFGGGRSTHYKINLAEN